MSYKPYFTIDVIAACKAIKALLCGIKRMRRIGVKKEPNDDELHYATTAECPSSPLASDAKLAVSPTINTSVFIITDTDQS
jgi:hypothetical protein